MYKDDCRFDDDEMMFGSMATNQSPSFPASKTGKCEEGNEVKMLAKDDYESKCSAVREALSMKTAAAGVGLKSVKLLSNREKQQRTKRVSLSPKTQKADCRCSKCKILPSLGPRTRCVEELQSKPQLGSNTHPETRAGPFSQIFGMVIPIRRLI